MYKVEFLPLALKDMDNITYYISNNLNNPSAAKELADSFINGAESLMNFPHGLSVFKPIKKLKYDYRSVKIKNFLMFYTINEEEKVVTIVRVLYRKMDINTALK